MENKKDEFGLTICAIDAFLEKVKFEETEEEREAYKKAEKKYYEVVQKEFARIEREEARAWNSLKDVHIGGMPPMD